jgi:hypothetical protein
MEFRKSASFVADSLPKPTKQDFDAEPSKAVFFVLNIALIASEYLSHNIISTAFKSTGLPTTHLGKSEESASLKNLPTTDLESSSWQFKTH